MEKGIAESLFGLLQNNQKSRWSDKQRTEAPQLWEFANSSIFVNNNLANFCTVSSTVLTVH